MPRKLSQPALNLQRSAAAKKAWRKRKKGVTTLKREGAGWKIVKPQLDTRPPRLRQPETNMGQEDPVTEMQGRLNKSISFNNYLRKKVAFQKELLQRAQKALLIMLEPVDLPFIDRD